MLAVVVAVIVIVAGLAAFIMLTSDDDDTMRIGVLPVMDTLPLLVADGEGIFEANGVKVELVPFNSAQERDAAFMAGSVDGFFGDPIITVLMARSGVDVSIVTVDYHTTEGHMMFGLVSSPDSDIRAFDEIGDAEVAISEGSVIEYFLDEMTIAEGHNGTIGRTAISSMPVRYQSLMNNDIELALLPEPLATMAMDEGAHLICDDGGIDTTATVIVMRGSYIDSHHDDIESFLDAYGEAVTEISESPEDHMGLLVEHARFPERLVDGYTLQPLSMPCLPPESEIVRLEDWMMGKGMLTETIPYQDLVSQELYA